MHTVNSSMMLRISLLAYQTSAINLLLCLQWIAQHEGLSCEKFAEWIRNNDSQFQEEGLIMQLQENGIGEI